MEKVECKGGKGGAENSARCLAEARAIRGRNVLRKLERGRLIQSEYLAKTI